MTQDLYGITRALEWFAERVAGLRLYAFGLFPKRIQMDGYSCGACAIWSLLRFHGIQKSFARIKRELRITPEGGTTFPKMIRVLRGAGLRVGLYDRGKRMRDLERWVARGPVIVHLDSNHVALAQRIDSKFVYLADSARLWPGLTRLPRAVFRRRWTRSDRSVVRVTR